MCLDDQKIIARLTIANSNLSKQVIELQEKLLLFAKHPVLAMGVRGETFVARLTGGTLAAPGSAHDMTIDHNGLKLEVKAAALNRPSKAQGTRRWNWKNLFGNSGKKVYDRLILFGYVDERYSTLYKDPTSKVILFDIPFNDVGPLTTKYAGKERSAICLTTNPMTARSAAKVLFSHYQVTEEELEARYQIS